MIHVDAALAGITAWLNEHAPATAAHLRGPAPAAEIVAMRGEVPQPLPEDLLRWWATTDGFTPRVTDPLIPDIYVPVTVQEARRLRRSWLDLAAPTDDDPAARGFAGELSHDFLDAFVPIAEDHCGQVLFVDVRDGPWYGCVNTWDHEQGALDPVVWDGVASMLEDIADGLTLGTPVLSSYADRLRATGHYAEVERVAAVSPAGALSWVPA